MKEEEGRFGRWDLGKQEDRGGDEKKMKKKKKKCSEVVEGPS